MMQFTVTEFVLKFKICTCPSFLQAITSAQRRGEEVETTKKCKFILSYTNLVKTTVHF